MKIHNRFDMAAPSLWFAKKHRRAFYPAKDAKLGKSKRKESGVRKKRKFKLRLQSPSLFARLFFVPFADFARDTFF